MRKPYIGIVGIKSVEEVVAVSQITSGFSASNSGRLVQMGVQVNGKVVDGLNKEGVLSNLRLPTDLAEVRTIFEYADQFMPNVLNVVHYSEKEKGRLAERVTAIFDGTGIYSDDLCRTIQLNGYLGEIDLKMVRFLKNKFSNLTIIMQVDGGMIGNFSDENVERVMSNLFYLSDYIGYALIDASGGRGLPMNVAKSVMLAQKIRAKMPNMGIGFAGGLNGDNARFMVSRLIEMFKDDHFSVDAESGLRNKMGTGYGEDIFDKVKARMFFEQTLRAFGHETG